MTLSDGGDKLLATNAIAIDTAGSSTLDLNDNDMLVTGGTGKATIESYIRNARNGGAWDQPGITSTAARNATPKNTTLGSLSGAQYLSLGYTTFDGSPIATSDVLIKCTWYGDTDFNHVVNFDDYSRTDNGFNTGGSDWFHGDFDYNGVVDFDDYALIDLAFNTQSGSLRRAMSYLDGGDPSERGMNTPALRMVHDHFDQFGEPYAGSLLAAVPEPTSLIPTSLVLLATVRGRRRRRF
jgi:hypothetical protein